MRSVSVTVTTTATEIVAPDNQNRYVYLHIVGNAPVYLGNSTVTTANGLLTEKHTSPIEIFVPLGESLYGVVSTATEDVRVLTRDID